MAAIIWSDVTTFASELSTVPVAAQTIVLAIANTHFDVSMFGGEDAFELKLIRILMAAHIAACTALPDAGAGAGGTTVVSESGGDGLSVTYGAATLITAASQLTETSYGRQLDAMVRSSPARAGVIL